VDSLQGPILRYLENFAPLDDPFSSTEPEDGDGPRLKPSKSDIARTCFLQALHDIERHGIEGNPLQVLKQDVLSKLSDIKKNSEGRSAYERRFYSDVAACKQAFSEALDHWARDCWLVVPSRTGTGVIPAKWVLTYAKALCDEWIEGRSGSGVMPWWTRQFQLPAEGQGGVLCIPMDDPSCRPDEPLKDFKKRVRKAVTAYLRNREAGRSLDAPLPLSNGRKASGDIPGTQTPRLDHYKWLVLYQCCRWSLEVIREESPRLGTASLLTTVGIWRGVQRAAALVGLKLRPGPLTRKAAKRVPKRRF
jgi:hypothetical protein